MTTNLVSIIESAEECYCPLGLQAIGYYLGHYPKVDPKVDFGEWVAALYVAYSDRTGRWVAFVAVIPYGVNLEDPEELQMYTNLLPVKGKRLMKKHAEAIFPELSKRRYQP